MTVTKPQILLYVYIVCMSYILCLVREPLANIVLTCHLLDKLLFPANWAQYSATCNFYQNGLVMRSLHLLLIKIGAL